jgi:hypothetical protein
MKAYAGLVESVGGLNRACCFIAEVAVQGRRTVCAMRRTKKKAQHLSMSG